MTSVHAVILAGGEGRRLGGVRKANVQIGGVTLIEKVTGALGEVAQPILVSTGPAGREWGLPPGYEGVRDLPASGGGPLAGLVASVLALRNRNVESGLLISVAVDTPFLPKDFVERMVRTLGTAPAAFASWNGSFYPTNALWRLEAICDVPERRGEIGSLKALLASLGAQRVGWDELAQDPFANVNTPDDLLTLEARAKLDGGL